MCDYCDNNIHDDCLETEGEVLDICLNCFILYMEMVSVKVRRKKEREEK